MTAVLSSSASPPAGSSWWRGWRWGGSFRNLICGDTHYFDLPDAFAAKSRIFPTTAETELAERVCALNTRIITGFGLKQGITHSEFIMDGDQIYLMETAARGGGVYISSDLIHLSTGLCTEDFLLDIAEGVCAEVRSCCPSSACAAIWPFLSPWERFGQSGAWPGSRPCPGCTGTSWTGCGPGTQSRPTQIKPPVWP